MLVSQAGDNCSSSRSSLVYFQSCLRRHPLDIMLRCVQTAALSPTSPHGVPCLILFSEISQRGINLCEHSAGARTVAAWSPR